MRLALPAAQVFEMVMVRGPFPIRHERVVRQGALDAATVLDYTAQELLAMRRWWLAQPPHPNAGEQRAREVCIAAIYGAFRDERKCLGCGGNLPVDYDPTFPPYCPDCARR